jgi:hypothetical protein
VVRAVADPPSASGVGGGGSSAGLQRTGAGSAAAAPARGRSGLERVGDVGSGAGRLRPWKHVRKKVVGWVGNKVRILLFLGYF